jgi:hypothetical protein
VTLDQPAGLDWQARMGGPLHSTPRVMAWFDTREGELEVCYATIG